MEAFHKYITEYRKQLKKGNIKEAYKGLMEYLKVSPFNWDSTQLNMCWGSPRNHLRTLALFDYKSYSHLSRYLLLS